MVLVVEEVTRGSNLDDENMRQCVRGELLGSAVRNDRGDGKVLP